MPDIKFPDDIAMLPVFIVDRGSTKGLLDRVIQRGCLVNPKDRTSIPVRRPL